MLGILIRCLRLPIVKTVKQGGHSLCQDKPFVPNVLWAYFLLHQGRRNAFLATVDFSPMKPDLLPATSVVQAATVQNKA
jgi:hypothetical protein